MGGSAQKSAVNAYRKRLATDRIKSRSVSRPSPFGAQEPGFERFPFAAVGRILSFDSKAALEWAELMAEGDRKGRPRSAIDMMIAAVAKANGCVVVTGNAKDFEGIEVFNPLG
jgi:PIN domain